MGQRHDRRAGRVSPAELVSLVVCDLGAIVRGRAVLASDLEEPLAAGVGWVPANHALTPLGPLAEPSPFGSTGDLRLMPDPQTRTRASAPSPGDERARADALRHRRARRAAVGVLPAELPRARARGARGAHRGDALHASFEHEFQLLGDERSELPFSLAAQRAVEPFAAELMGALVEADVEPERFFAEYASHQFEVPVAPAPAARAADRAVVLREVVREVARREGRRAHASCRCSTPPRRATACTSTSACTTRAAGRCCTTRRGPGELERARRQLRRGRARARALRSARSRAPSPVSARAPAPAPLERGRGLPRRAQPRDAAADPAAGRRSAARAPRRRCASSTAAPTPPPTRTWRSARSSPPASTGSRTGMPAPPILDRDPATLDEQEAERFGVGRAARDARGGARRAGSRTPCCAAALGEPLYEAYAALKRAELAAGRRSCRVEERCRRYAEVY